MRFKGNKPIYIELAEYFINLIEKGAYKNGDYLPSVRDIAILEGINPNTVHRSYQYLEEMKYAVGIPKKGFYISYDGNNNESELKEELNKLIDRYSSKEVLDTLHELLKENQKWLRLQT